MRVQKASPLRSPVPTYCSIRSVAEKYNDSIVAGPIAAGESAPTVEWEGPGRPVPVEHTGRSRFRRGGDNGVSIGRHGHRPTEIVGGDIAVHPVTPLNHRLRRRERRCQYPSQRNNPTRAMNRRCFNIS